MIKPTYQQLLRENERYKNMITYTLFIATIIISIVFELNSGWN